MITWEDFEKIEIITGTIIEAEDFPEARKPAYKLLIDFGPRGMKRSSAQITGLYGKEELIGRQIAAVTNFPVKRIAGFKSECLVLGTLGKENEIVLLSPERDVANGLRVS